MARYLGDTWTLTGTVTDPTGALVDAGNVTVTIWQPNATTVGPFATAHATLGIYTYPFTATMAGMHTAVFTATGGNASVGPVDFYVEPALSTGLVTLPEVKTELKIPQASTLKDPQLLQWIRASRALIEQYTGPLVAATFVEQHDGGAPMIVLDRRPVVSIASVTETFGANVIRNLTLQPIDGSITVDAYGYTLESDSGVLVRRVVGIAAPFALGRKNIIVAYTAGVAGAWPANIRLANMECLRIWYLATQEGVRPQSMSGGAVSGVEDLTAQSIGYVLPARVVKMLGESIQPDGIA